MYRFSFKRNFWGFHVFKVRPTPPPQAFPQEFQQYASHFVSTSGTKAPRGVFRRIQMKLDLHTGKRKFKNCATAGSNKHCSLKRNEALLRCCTAKKGRTHRQLNLGMSYLLYTIVYIIYIYFKKNIIYIHVVVCVRTQHIIHKSRYIG